jgi:hypothetical protein
VQGDSNVTVTGGFCRGHTAKKGNGNREGDVHDSDVKVPSLTIRRYFGENSNFIARVNLISMIFSPLLVV